MPCVRKSVSPIDELERAFDAGDYRTVREQSAALIDSDDEAVRKRARALRAKTEADPNIKWLFLTALVVILAVTAYWMRH